MRRFSAVAGGVALAVIMLPIVVRTTEEMVRLVPASLREAGLALGVPEWKVVLRVVLPTARAGIVTGAMVAVARVAGETAPLLFTAFGNRFWHQGLDQPIAALPLQIFAYAIAPYDDWHREAVPGARVVGTVLQEGQDIYSPGVDPVEVRRRIGMVFQKPNPFPTMTVFDNVAAGVRLGGVRDRAILNERVERALHAAALWDEVKDRLAKPGAGLSGGQQQRLCIARALAVEPEA